MIRRETPERRYGRSGVLLSLLLLLPPLAGGCDRIAPSATVQLDSAEIQLPRGAEVHVVRVVGAGAVDSIAPATVEAKSGDAVRLIAGDHRTHALAFGPGGLEADVQAFLEQTGQLRGPPLVNEGAEWVVLLEGAPAGRYPFYCRTHDAGGVLVVRPED